MDTVTPATCGDDVEDTWRLKWRQVITGTWGLLGGSSLAEEEDGYRLRVDLVFITAFSVKRLSHKKGNKCK